jgi:hypothetical protein
MRLHWSYSDLPELTELSASEREHVLGRAWWRAHGRWPPWAGLVGMTLFVYVGSVLGSTIGHERIGEAIGAVTGGLVYAQIVIEVARSVVRDTVERQRRQ